MPRADLQLTKSATPDPVIAGQPVTYTLTASNVGPSDVDSFTVTDTLPTGLTFVSASSSPQCSAAGQVVTCAEPAAFAASATPRIFTVVAAVAPGTASATRLANRAEVTSATVDPDGSNNTGNSVCHG